MPDGVEPLRESFALALGEHGREGSDVSGEGLQFGALSKDHLEPQLLDFGEGFGAAEDPLETVRGDGGFAVTGCGDVRFFLM
ncbi:hypothetical protein Srufu_000160 [Streptomyces libani subsp. rufus]|nr:hypothetical protein Srufu_000160 [Streptomyces libani subsp. rufus]